MAECDGNYHKILRLFPNLRESDSRTYVLEAPASQDQNKTRDQSGTQSQTTVVFDVLEKGPYTTLLQITLSPGVVIQPASNSTASKGSRNGATRTGARKTLPAEKQDLKGVPSRWAKMASLPQMTVRVYHDAQSAEIVSYQQQNRFHSVYEYPNKRMRQKDEKVQLNQFLGEFLNYSLAQGISAAAIEI